MKKGVGTLTVILICLILCVGVTVAGVFIKSNIMIIVGASALAAVAFISSIVGVVRLVIRSKQPKDDDDDDRVDRRAERVEPRASDETERKPKKKSVFLELLKSSLVIGGFLTSCVLFVVFAAIGEFMLGFIVWCCGVGLTILAFVIMLVRESIASSDMGAGFRQRQAERKARKALRDERRESERVSEPLEPTERGERYERAPSVTEPLEPSSRERSATGVTTGRYELVRATVESCEMLARRDDYVDCGGRTFAWSYGVFDVRLRSGGETVRALSAVEYKRGCSVYALVAGDVAVIVRGSEIRFADGKYKVKTGTVRLCIVDVGSMVEKRKRWGDAADGENWAVDPDHRFIVTADVDGRRVRAESEIYLNEGTEATFLVGRLGAVIIRD